jgi:tripartite motif-containing protein 56
MAALSATSTALTTTGRIGVNTASPAGALDVTGATYLNSGSGSGSVALWTLGRVGVNNTAPGFDLDVNGRACVTASSATATALTTVGRIGVNTTAPTVDFEVNGLAKLGNVTIGANPLYAFTQHTFTNASATGRTGPTLSAVRSAYTGVSWAQNNSYLSMTGDNGIQLWTVPVTGNYIIRAVGAAGFIGPGLSNARGIDIQTTTTLIKGEVIKILVGQRGSWQGTYTYMGSGGGGSFVVRENSTPIIIAGGGGGTGGGGGSYVVSDASKETDGMNGSGNIDSYGTNGGGGKGGQGSGGGGFLQGGFAGINNSIPPSSFLTGGVGGLATGGSGAGGFGGGGYAHDTSGFQTGGGGGGGYSGGGGGTDNQPGGGGGSFAISALTVNGYNTGHGYVTITLLSPSSDFDVAGVSRLSASSATATALTTVGRIGVNTAAPTADLDVTGVSRLSASSATATALTTVGRIGVNTAAM